MERTKGGGTIEVIYSGKRTAGKIVKDFVMNLDYCH